MWIEKWLDLAGYEVALENMCLKSLSECRGRMFGANVKGEMVPYRGASEGEGYLSESLLVADTWSCKKMSEARGWVVVVVVVVVVVFMH